MSLNATSAWDTIYDAEHSCPRARKPAPNRAKNVNNTPGYSVSKLSMPAENDGSRNGVNKPNAGEATHAGGDRTGNKTNIDNKVIVDNSLGDVNVNIDNSKSISTHNNNNTVVWRNNINTYQRAL